MIKKVMTEQREIMNEINRELMVAKEDYSDLLKKVRNLRRQIIKLKQLLKES